MKNNGRPIAIKPEDGDEINKRTGLRAKTQGIITQAGGGSSI